jgi:protein-S-isoprenylcysteine O-methyltransferase Ste14
MRMGWSLLCGISSALFLILIVVGAFTAWFDFLLLPVTWLVAWLTCGLIIALGVYFFALSKREFDLSKQKMSPPSSPPPPVLITSGIYSSIRHPHYLATMLWSFAAAIGLRSFIGLLIALVGIPVTYALALEEENVLVHEFGEAYREHRAKVPMFIPRLRRKKGPSP